MLAAIPLFPKSASTMAGSVDALYWFLVAISVFFSLLIGVVLIYLAVRYRRRHADEVGVPLHGNTMLEIGWSVLPFIIVMVMFYWGAKVFFQMATPPVEAVEYYATGKQWMWKFQHPTGQREINQLHVPVGVPIKMTMTSEDVIHSFFVPAFRVKMDVVPGRYTTVWFEATRTGTYHLFCAEYCGTEHSKMGGSVVVMEQADYEAWLSGVRGQTQVATGEELFQKYSCYTCHRPDSSARAPILQGLFGKTVKFNDGTDLVVDTNYLRESILNPRARVVEGYQPVMPTFQGQMTEEEVLELVQYIRSME
jgi:cytochrome c oxidase subunit 2